jgi:hypothetical protein
MVPMSENRSPNDSGPASDTSPGKTARSLSESDVSAIWEQFKSGAVVRCPKDDAPLALAVDGAAKSYRLVCTRCGNASLWFETNGGAVQVRNADEPSGPGLDD